MARYYMNGTDFEGFKSDRAASQYEGLIQDYLDAGGTVTYCEEGATTEGLVWFDKEEKFTGDDWSTDPDLRDNDLSLMDKIWQGEPTDPDAYFDDKKELLK